MSTRTWNPIACQSTDLELSGLPLPRNFAWTLTGNVAYSASQWLMLVLLARFGDPVMVGQFALGLAVTAPVFMLANLQLRAVQATDTRGTFLFSEYLGLRLITTVLAVLAVAGIILVAGYRRETTMIILAVAAAKALESICDVFYGMFQRYERMDYIARSMIVRGLLSALGLGYVVWLTGSALWGVLAVAMVWGIVLARYDFPVGRSILRHRLVLTRPRGLAPPACSLHPRWRSDTLKRLAGLSFPMGIVMMLISLNSNIPRYFVERYLSERDLGIFSAMAYLTVAGITAVGALGISASTPLAKSHSERNLKVFGRLVLRLLIIALGLGLLGVLVAAVAGKELLSMLYGQEYAENSDVLTWLMVSAAIGYLASVLGIAATAARVFRQQMPVFALVTVITGIGCLILVPTRGLLGASWALCIGMTAQLLGSLLLFRSHVFRSQNREKHGNWAA